MSIQTAKSAAIAGTARRLSGCPRQTATSATRATVNRAVVSGTSSWVAIISAKAVISAARIATQGIICRLCRHPSAIVSTTKAASTVDAAAAERTWQRAVDSQSKGERINTEVNA